MLKVKATIAAAIAAALMALTGTAAAAPAPTQIPAAQLPAGVVQVGNVLVETVNPCSCVTAIDGYSFAGVPYYNASSAVDSAVELWWLLLDQPGYASQPAITSVSVAIEVAGTVGDDDSDPPERSSWG